MLGSVRQPRRKKRLWPWSHFEIHQFLLALLQRQVSLHLPMKCLLISQNKPTQQKKFCFIFPFLICSKNQPKFTSNQTKPPLVTPELAAAYLLFCSVVRYFFTDSGHVCFQFFVDCCLINGQIQSSLIYLGTTKFQLALINYSYVPEDNSGPEGYESNVHIEGSV